MQFQDIEILVDDILYKEQGIFFGVDHDDTFFHEYLVDLILKLKSKYTIHFLLEASHEYVSKIFSQLSDVKTEDLKNVILQNKIQFPVLVAALLNRSAINVKGIDVPLEDLLKLHDPNSKSPELSQLVANRTLEQGNVMVKNILEIKQTIKNDKYIILGGPMHGDVPKKLNIKSINMLENKILSNMTKDFLSLSMKKMKELASREELKPNYAFFYDGTDAIGKLLAKTTITIEPPPELLSHYVWMPAFSFSVFLPTLITDPPLIVQNLKEDFPDVEVNAYLKPLYVVDVICKAPNKVKFSELVKFFSPISGRIKENEKNNEIIVLGSNINTSDFSLIFKK